MFHWHCRAWSSCRIHKYASCSAECFILALVYIDRLIQGNNLTLTSLNVHRVIITSVMLAAKFFDDQYFNNAYFAKVGGVPCPEMNSLELEFLFSINFSLHVSGEIYNRYRGELSTHMASMLPEADVARLQAVMITAPSAAEPVSLVAAAPAAVQQPYASAGSSSSSSSAAVTSEHAHGVSTQPLAQPQPVAVPGAAAAGASSSSSSSAAPSGMAVAEQQQQQPWMHDEDEDEDMGESVHVVVGQPATTGGLAGMFPTTT